MYALILFFIFFIVSTVESSQGYAGRKDVIAGCRNYFDGFGIRSQGTFLISDSCNSKVVTCFAGMMSKDYYNKKQINNPVSILDLSTSEDKPFKKIPELSSKIPVSVVGLTDNNMVLIAHDKSIYIFADPEHGTGRLVSLISNIGYVWRHFFSYPRPKSVLQQISQLKPERCDDKDKIIAIESSNSRVIAVSEKGSITIWPRKDREVLEQQKKTALCNEPFSAVAFDKETNTLCLGLWFGKIFIINAAADKITPRVVSVFPNTFSRVNCMNFSNEQLLCAALCDCSNINCCREGCSIYLNNLLKKNKLNQCSQCHKETNCTHDICKHRLDYINSLPLFCNCHLSELDTFLPLFYLLKKISIDEDVLLSDKNNDVCLKIINMVFEMKVMDFKISIYELHNRCNNKYTILSRAQLNEKDIQQRSPIFDVNSNENCCKKIALLPNGKLVIHTHLCQKNPENDGIYEQMKITGCNNDTSNAQAVYSISTSKMEVDFGSEYPVHLTQDGERVHMLGEMNGSGYRNQQIVFNTWYAPGRSFICNIKNLIALQSYFSFAMKHIVAPCGVSTIFLYLTKKFFS